MDVIKQIDDAANAYLLWVCDGDRFTKPFGELTEAEKRLCDSGDTLEAALSVLQKMASGEDWFDVGGDYPAPSAKHALKEGLSVWVKGGRYLKPEISLCDGEWWRSEDCGDAPTHWRHIDTAKHIKMLMEQEMKL